MKVITIKQPYATLIAEGIKKYEFRTWKTNYRGEILIHAGKSIDKKAMEQFRNYHFSYPTSCIIAKVTITDCIQVDEKQRQMLKTKNPLVYRNVIKDKTWNGYAFKLEKVQKIEPIKINGKLGLWNYDIIKI